MCQWLQHFCPSPVLPLELQTCKLNGKKKSFYLEMISNLWKASKNKNSTKNVCIPFAQIHLMWTFYTICVNGPVCLCGCVTDTFLWNLLRENYIYHDALLLYLCVFRGEVQSLHNMSKLNITAILLLYHLYFNFVG